MMTSSTKRFPSYGVSKMTISIIRLVVVQVDIAAVLDEVARLLVVQLVEVVQSAVVHEVVRPVFEEQHEAVVLKVAHLGEVEAVVVQVDQTEAAQEGDEEDRTEDKYLEKHVQDSHFTHPIKGFRLLLTNLF
jgi:hypothetical protein